MTHKNELGKLTQEIRANGLTEETRQELRKVHDDVVSTGTAVKHDADTLPKGDWRK